MMLVSIMGSSCMSDTVMASRNVLTYLLKSKVSVSQNQSILKSHCHGELP